MVATLVCPDLPSVLLTAPAQSLLWSYLFGVLWGIGGLTFGLSMRYLGMSLGYALALGFCAAFGTVLRQEFIAQFSVIITTLSGWLTLGGVLVCLAGIAVCGLAGVAKERELPADQKTQVISEFNFAKGVWVAIFAEWAPACPSPLALENRLRPWPSSMARRTCGRTRLSLSSSWRGIHHEFYLVRGAELAQPHGRGLRWRH